MTERIKSPETNEPLRQLLTLSTEFLKDCRQRPGVAYVQIKLPLSTVFNRIGSDVGLGYKHRPQNEIDFYHSGKPKPITDIDNQIRFLQDFGMTRFKSVQAPIVAGASGEVTLSEYRAAYLRGRTLEVSSESPLFILQVHAYSDGPASLVERFVYSENDGLLSAQIPDWIAPEGIKEYEVPGVMKEIVEFELDPVRRANAYLSGNPPDTRTVTELR